MPAIFQVVKHVIEIIFSLAEACWYQIDTWLGCWKCNRKAVLKYSWFEFVFLAWSVFTSYINLQGKVTRFFFRTFTSLYVKMLIQTLTFLHRTAILCPQTKLVFQSNEIIFEYLCSLNSHMNINTLRPEQNGRHFAEDIFKCILLKGEFYILIQISLKCVPWGLIDNKSTFGSGNDLEVIT